MENNRFALQAMKWVPKGEQRKRSRPRNNGKATLEDDLNVMGMSWEEAEKTSGDRTMWRSGCVARLAREGLRSKVRSNINIAIYQSFQ